MEVLEYLSRQSRWVLMAVALLMNLLLGAADFVTGVELSFSIFYLAPVVLVTWCAGRRLGVLMSVICAATWLFADVEGGHVYSHTLIPYWNAAVRLGFFLTVTVCLSLLKQALVRERALSSLDHLTQVANARSFYQLAGMEIERARRSMRPLTLAYLDVDNFKTVNDRRGHKAGDALLALIGKTIKKSIRGIDAAARLGGDEFAVLFPETGCAEGQAAANRLQANLLRVMKENDWPVTFSIGAVTFNRPPESVDEMVRQADDLMYSAKNAGRNRVLHAVAGQSGVTAQEPGAPSMRRTQSVSGGD